MKSSAAQWIGCLLLCCFHNTGFKTADAVVAKPAYFEVRQPNKETIELRLEGDENLHWLVDRDGNTVVKTERHGFQYSKGLDSEGKLVASGVLVGKAGARRLAEAAAAGTAAAGTTAAAGARTRPRPTAAAGRRRAHLGGGGLKLGGAPEGIAAAAAAAGGRPGRRGRALSGAAATLKNLVVPILFSDHADRDLPSQDDLDQLWNAPGGHPSWEAYANQSVKEFYYEQSYGGLALESTVLGWIEIDSTEEECANGDSGTGNAWMDCLREALETADVSIDFEDFDQDGDGYIDAIAFMHSGYGAEYGGYDTYGAYYTDRIWSHKWAIFDVDNYAWDPFTSDEGVVVFEYHVETALYGTSGSQVTSIGVAAHETGHFLGLPDLYDTDYSSAGISTWGVMANSWGWDGTGGNPPSFSAWSKYALGWVEPTELEESGSYTISDIQSNADVYMVSNAYPDGEYLLIENRQAKGADKDSPQGGLLVWHIDEYWSGNTYEGYPGQNGWPENGYHYLTALLQADGDFELEKGSSPDAYDVFHSGGVSALSADTGDYPSSMAYQGGTVYSTGFELADISASGDSMTFSAVVGNSTTGSSGSSDPTSGLTLEMFDSWGDGWNGNYLGLYAMDDEGAGALNTFTLLTGAEGEAKVAVANGTCYSWMASAPLGTWQSEVSWSLPACGIDGDMYTTSYFCIDDVGNCAEYVHDCDYNLTLSMMDSWGDGWSGNVFGLFDKEDSSNVQNATMYSGFSKTECLNVEPSQCYTFQLAKEGTWQDEMSWSIGNGEIQGYAHTAYSFCIGDDGSVTSDNPSGLTLSMFDSWGDGWNGNSLGLFSLEDPAADAISTYTLYSGSEGEEIVVVQNSTCYSMYVETVGSWGSEVSWEICDIEGGIDTTAYFCIDDVGSCSEYVHDCNFNLTMHKFDSWGDGWNGNIISLYDDSDEAIQNVTLYGGFSGVECLDVELSQCYSLKLSEEGSWPEEITWAVEGVVDNAHSQTEVSFCLDDGGQITVDYPNGLTLTMFDSWGDGWNGNSFGLFAMDDEGAGAISTYTLYSGSEGEEIVVVQNSTCYSMYVEALGAYGSEVSWEICGIEGGIETTAYFCIDDVGSCSEYVHECNYNLTVHKFDSWGDGWNGNIISLYDDSDEAIQNMTLYGGFSGVECLDVELSQCYSLKLSEEGSWPEEITWAVEGVVDNAHSQTEVSFCLDDGGQITVDYPNGLTLTMFDSWGDGWNGNSFGLFAMDDEGAGAISTYTLYSGSEGEEIVVVQNSTCYSMYVEALGAYGSEVSWEICGIEGGIETTAYFCIDDVGSCSEYVHDCDLKMDMYDSWGDGWNGNTISLYDDSDEVVQEVTLYGGFSGVECLDVEVGQCYSVKLSEEGSYAEEVTFSINGIVNDANYQSEVSFCVDNSTSPPEYSTGGNQYGVAFSMFDSWGDGWNGNFFGLFSLEDPAADAISTHTLSSGYEGEETVVVETSACYSMYVVAMGSWGSEVSWEICGIEGGIETTAYFCIDDVGSCSEYVHECDLKMEMYDSWGDGWNGNIISLYGDSDEVVQEVTLYGGFSGVECLDVELGQCYSLKLSEEGSWPEELTWAVEGVVYNATAESEVSFCTDESETAESSDEYSVEISMCLVVSTEDLSASACSSAVHSVITDFLYATDGLSGGETLILTMTAVDGDACSRRALKDAALSFKASSSTQKPSTTAGSAATEDDGTLAYDINIKIVVDSEAAAETFAEAFQDEVDEGALEDALAEEDLTVEQLSATATAKGTSGGASSSSDNDGDSSTTATLSSSDGETETSSSEDVDAVTTESESESEDTTESEEDEETLAGDMAGAARLLLARRGAGVFLVALAAVVGVAVVLPF